MLPRSLCPHLQADPRLGQVQIIHGRFPDGVCNRRHRPLGRRAVPREHEAPQGDVRVHHLRAADEGGLGQPAPGDVEGLQEPVGAQALEEEGRAAVADERVGADVEVAQPRAPLRRVGSGDVSWSVETKVKRSLKDARAIDGWPNWSAHQRGRTAVIAGSKILAMRHKVLSFRPHACGLTKIHTTRGRTSGRGAGYAALQTSSCGAFGEGGTDLHNEGL